MDFEQQKNIYLQVISHFNDLNSLLGYNKTNIDTQKFTDYLNERIFNLETTDATIFLSSLLLFVFNLNTEVLKIKKENINHIIIVNFINTILEELNLKQIEYEVL